MSKEEPVGKRKSPSGPELVLYTSVHSYHCTKVVMALHLKNLGYKNIDVDIYQGRQYTNNFLSMNPLAEVPVLRDGVVSVVGSEKIIDYLEDNFSDGNPRLRPEDLIQRKQCDQFTNLVCDLKIAPLIYGSIKHNDLYKTPKTPYDNPKYCNEVLNYAEKQPIILRSELNKFRSHGAVLNSKLARIEEELLLWKNREAFESLLIEFERVLDNCEAELSCHDSFDWWLCSPKVSIADVHLSILLHRLWLLGLEQRMWDRQRPNVRRYFNRIQRLESFKQAIMTPPSQGVTDLINKPFMFAMIGAAMIGGGFFLWNKHGRPSLKQMIRLVQESIKKTPIDELHTKSMASRPGKALVTTIR